jgi:hypothetical protein
MTIAKLIRWLFPMRCACGVRVEFPDTDCGDEDCRVKQDQEKAW